MPKRVVIALLLSVLAPGCAVLGLDKGAKPPVDPVVADSASIDPLFAATFRERIDRAMALYAFGETADFLAVRDSLESSLDSLVLSAPSLATHPDFLSLTASLSELDSLCPAGLGHSYLAEDDSLALSLSWPDLSGALGEGPPAKEGSPFPLVWNDRVEFWIRYFQGPGRERFERALYQMELHRPVVERILEEKGLPRDILCIALIESGFHLKARSRARAVGPWQFLEGTARIYGLRVDWWYDERRDIVASTYAAANYLKDLYGLWNDWFLAFAAYNCGEGRVARAIAEQKTQDFWALSLPKQTERYVPKFLAALYIVTDPARYGFVIPQAEPIEFDEVVVKDATDVKLIAECCGTTSDHIAELNPSLLRWCTPPETEVSVKVPAGKGDECARKLEAIPPEQRVTWRKHLVRKGETLSAIAGRYGTTVVALKSVNKIKDERRIRAGSHLIVPVQGAWAEEASSKPRYRDVHRKIDKAALDDYVKRTSAPAGQKKIVYVVKKNDTLGEIAQVYRTTAAKIRRWNNLSYRSHIYPGQKLFIYVPESIAAPRPSSPSTDSGSPAETTKYRVKKGDTFYSISKKFNVPLADLLAWNGKQPGSSLYAGEVLEIRKPSPD